MKNIAIPIIFFVGMLSGCNGKPPKKAVFIILDGIPADVIEKQNTPTLDEIAAKGGYSRAFMGGEKNGYSETPTISAPGYMNIITGTWANKHNVWDNDDQKPNYNYWNVFRIAKTANPSLKTAIFSTWLDNRTVLIGDGKPETNHFKMDAAFDGYEKDTLRFPHGNNSKYISAIDEYVSAEAANYIEKNAPDLSWVYLEYTDDMGHSYGDSEAFYQSITQADNQVKKIWEAVQKREKMNEDWLIIVTTDHGRDSINGMDHGSQSERERITWVVTNSNNLNTRFKKGLLPAVDIAPSILSHLNITPDPEVVKEMDGISFIGNAGLDNLKANVVEDQLKISWNPLLNTGNTLISISFTNHFKTGSNDFYTKIGEPLIHSGTFSVTLSQDQMEAFRISGLIKVLAETPYNTSNYWVVKPN